MRAAMRAIRARIMKTNVTIYSTHLISYENEFLTGAQIEQLRKVFDAFDIDESKSLEKEELKQLVQKLNLHAQKDSIDMLLYSFDVNNSKSIEFNEFVQIFGTSITEKEVEKNAKIVHKIQQLFKLIDTTDKGYILKEDLKKAQESIHSKLVKKESKKSKPHGDEDANEVNTMFKAMYGGTEEPPEDAQITLEKFKEFFLTGIGHK